MNKNQLIAGGVALAIIILCYLIVLVGMFAGHPKKEEPKTDITTKEGVKTTPHVKASSEKEEEAPIIEESLIEHPVAKQTLGYRLTSYSKDDGTGVGNCTGSGKCIKDFEINSKGWYTYQGKLVLGGATKACLNTTRDQACMKFSEVNNRHYFSYFEEIIITIDDVSYDAIILDSCGACMHVSENRLDIFVSSGQYKIDRGYRGNNLTTVEFRE